MSLRRFFSRSGLRLFILSVMTFSIMFLNISIESNASDVEYEPYIMFDSDVTGVTGTSLSSGLYSSSSVLYDGKLPSCMIADNQYTITVKAEITGEYPASSKFLITLPNSGYGTWLWVTMDGAECSVTYTPVTGVPSITLMAYSSSPSVSATNHYKISMVSCKDASGNELLDPVVDDSSGDTGSDSSGTSSGRVEVAGWDGDKTFNWTASSDFEIAEQGYYVSETVYSSANISIPLDYTFVPSNTYQINFAIGNEYDYSISYPGEVYGDYFVVNHYYLGNYGNECSEGYNDVALSGYSGSDLNLHCKRQILGRMVF